MIAFGSIEHCVGTTCISLALANYICSKLGKRTAYIELNTTNQIRCFSDKKELFPFSYMGITFFPARTLASLSEILIMPFDFFILDIGVLNAYTVKEFSRCDEQFLVCSLCEWKKSITLEKLTELMQKNNLHQEHVTVLANADIKKSKLTISPKIKCRFYTLPFIANPFRLSCNDFNFYHQLIFKMEDQNYK